MKEENRSRLCIWAGNIAPFLNIYWVLLSARAASASLSLGFLLKWPGLQQCLQADESTVYAHKRHSGNTAQVRGSAAEFPSLPFTAQGPTLDSVLGLGQQAQGGQGGGGRARRSL